VEIAAALFAGRERGDDRDGHECNAKRTHTSSVW